MKQGGWIDYAEVAIVRVCVECDVQRPHGHSGPHVLGPGPEVIYAIDHASGVVARAQRNPDGTVHVEVLRDA